MSDRLLFSKTISQVFIQWNNIFSNEIEEREFVRTWWFSYQMRLQGWAICHYELLFLFRKKISLPSNIAREASNWIFEARWSLKFDGLYRETILTSGGMFYDATRLKEISDYRPEGNMEVSNHHRRDRGWWGPHWNFSRNDLYGESSAFLFRITLRMISIPFRTIENENLSWKQAAIYNCIEFLDTMSY